MKMIAGYRNYKVKEFQLLQDYYPIIKSIFWLWFCIERREY
jgi:hypothetical protein